MNAKSRCSSRGIKFQAFHGRMAYRDYPIVFLFLRFLKFFLFFFFMILNITSLCLARIAFYWMLPTTLLQFLSKCIVHKYKPWWKKISPMSLYLSSKQTKNLINKWIHWIISVKSHKTFSSWKVTYLWKKNIFFCFISESGWPDTADLLLWLMLNFNFQENSNVSWVLSLLVKEKVAFEQLYYIWWVLWVT